MIPLRLHINTPLTWNYGSCCSSLLFVILIKFDLCHWKFYYFFQNHFFVFFKEALSNAFVAANHLCECVNVVTYYVRLFINCNAWKHVFFHNYIRIAMCGTSLAIHSVRILSSSGSLLTKALFAKISLLEWLLNRVKRK